MGPDTRRALAISIFLRQHDLVQVQWVTLSSGTPEHPSETRGPYEEIFASAIPYK